jgi:DNA-binding protein H-NS
MRAAPCQVSQAGVLAFRMHTVPKSSVIETLMARPRNLALLSLEALFKLRDDVAAALSRKADALKKQLASLGSDYAEVGRIAVYGRKRGSALKGRKAPIKYRDKAGNHWSGRGAQPRWMTAAIKAGAKRDDFLVDKSVAKKGRKKVRRNKK